MLAIAICELDISMNIALIGATGFVGSALLEELLNRGHQVRALQRDAAKLTARPGLEVRSVDVMNDELSGALKGVDAVVSAFNAGWANPNLHDDFLRGSDLIANARLVQAERARHHVVGGAGSLYIAPGQQLVDSPNFPAEWKQGALAAREVLTRLRADTSDPGLDLRLARHPARAGCAHGPVPPGRRIASLRRQG